MAQVNFVYDINSSEAREFIDHIYTIEVDGVAINAANLFEFPADYNKDVRDRVLEEMKILCEEKRFSAIQAMTPEHLAKTLEGEAAVNEAARFGRYKSHNAHFGEWLENQCRNAARYWVQRDKEGLVIGQLLLAMICHIHSNGFYHDMTMSWKEAVETGRQHLWESLTKVFAVA